MASPKRVTPNMVPAAVKISFTWTGVGAASCISSFGPTAAPAATRRAPPPGAARATAREEEAASLGGAGAGAGGQPLV